MYLNNKNKGLQIVINPLQVLKSVIPYTLSENGKNGKVIGFEGGIDLSKVSDNETGFKYLERITFETMLASNQFEGFEISEDAKNWKFENELFRINIPNRLFIDSLQKQDALGQMIASKLTNLADFSVKTDNWIAVYVTNMTEQERQILETYVDVIIEEQ